jgi:hypothetical protein
MKILLDFFNFLAKICFDGKGSLLLAFSHRGINNILVII